MTPMNVLIACEESQTECAAFRKKGHNAFSCDLVDPSGGHPEWHIKGDAIPVLRGGRIVTMDGKVHMIDKWDLVIAHPPCTFISNAGACRLYPTKGNLNLERFIKGLYAKLFFMAFWYFGYFGCAKVCIENPTPSKVFDLPKATQVVQPYEYGEPWTKRTLLWLFNLPPLKPTKIIENPKPWVCGNAEIWKKQAAAGMVYGKEKSAKHRSKAFHGLADAMADQWG